MSDNLPPCPQPPDWSVPWEELDAGYPWLRDLRGCGQDSVHHGEGDVWVHTRLVCEAMASLPAWRGLEEEARGVLFAAALLHDVAKPACRREQPAGHIGFPNHTRRGAIMARGILWRLGVPFAVREQVCALVRHHLKPFHLIENTDPRRLALEVSQTARCDWLALLAEADARGRVCQDLYLLLDNIALFAEFCREQGCLDRPWSFPSDHARFLYFREEGRSPDHPPYEDFGSEVVLMSGLPGSGKDTWLAQHLPGWPVVSLDELREELDIGPTDTQGAVLSRAREQARDHLRHARSFAWNATNLSRQVRGECLRLFAAYRAKIRIVYLEVSEECLKRQNRQRPAPVPGRVIEKMLSRWEVPDWTEAHRLDWCVRS
jgi:predicted kinase